MLVSAKAFTLFTLLSGTALAAPIASAEAAKGGSSDAAWVFTGGNVKREATDADAAWVFTGGNVKREKTDADAAWVFTGGNVKREKTDADAAWVFTGGNVKRDPATSTEAA